MFTTILRAIGRTSTPVSIRGASHARRAPRRLLVPAFEGLESRAVPSGFGFEVTMTNDEQPLYTDASADSVVTVVESLYSADFV